MALSFDQIVVRESQTPQTRPKKILESVLHFLAYHFILSRRSTRHVTVAGLDLTVGPTVFDPRFFLTSAFFAEFILGLDLRGKRVADVGTGSGILAIAAAKAGASEVVAIDINPYAVAATNVNAKKNGVAGTVKAIIGHLLSPVPAGARFDLILTNPPFFEGQPRDVADRANRRAAELANTFGNHVGRRKKLISLFVQQQVIVAKMRSRNMPMEILGLQVKRKEIGEQCVEGAGNVASGLGAEAGRRFKAARAVGHRSLVVHGVDCLS